MKTRYRPLCAILAMLSIATVKATAAESYPSHSVRVIVPYQAGGGLDMMCRSIMAEVGKRLKQPFVIENRTGASGTIGASEVARAAPDGYTLLCANNSEVTLAPFMMKDLPYSPERDLAPITMAVTQTIALLANSAVPADNIKQLFELSRKKPLLYATPGKGTNLELAMRMLSDEAHVPFNDVPYRGAAGLVTDVLAGHVPLAIINLAPVLPYIASKNLRPLLVFQSKRNPTLPDVPTTKEAVGVDIPAYSWFGFLAPAQTPVAIRSKLDQEIRRALAQPAVAEKLEKVHMDVVALPSAKFAEAIKQERAYYASIVQRFNLRPN